ncbi:hypothetical protein QUA08_04565 [Microcoleus sp. T3B2]|uniref:hypothetical protein n=1 Tax=Microcoleus sp. T3B2 TaxID=3055426 RepID=UPI002FD00EB1
MPVPQRLDFLVEQAEKPVPKRLIENGARYKLYQFRLHRNDIALVVGHQWKQVISNPVALE